MARNVLLFIFATVSISNSCFGIPPVSPQNAGMQIQQHSYVVQAQDQPVPNQREVKDALLRFNYVKKGSFFLNQGDHEKAIQWYTKAIELGVEDPRVFCNRGVCYGQMGKYDEAIRDFGEAIKRGQVSRAFANRGYVHMLRNAYDSAINDYTRALEGGDPERLIINRGYCHWKLNHTEAALRDIK